MHKQNIKGQIKLVSNDDLLSSGVKHDEGEIVEMPLVNLYPFKNHPFKVLDDEYMKELTESIKEKGVLSPAIVRKRANGGYEIISGHRRKHACELAGLMTMPVIIKNLEDDEATILMVDANIQREDILPCERAFALQMKMKARKHQGERNDLSCGTEFHKSTSEEIGKEEGLSGRQVRQYVRLTKLLPGILDRVDKEKIGIKQAVDLSFIEKPEQKLILLELEKTDRKMTGRQAKQLREAAESGLLDADTVCEIITGKSAVIKTVTLSEKELSKFFSSEMDSHEIKTIILRILDEWKTKM